MKPIEYRRSWSANKTREEELRELYGVELHFVDTNMGYETSESYLFRKGRKYYWLTADDCSCWDGNYFGWELTQAQLFKLAQQYIDRGIKERHQYQMAEWVLQNVKTS